MEIRWLQDFLTLAELGNFTRAAEAKHTSQAAFSRRIQQLETWLGTQLVDRTVFPTRPTAEGMRFRARASQILQQAVDAREETSHRIPSDRVRFAIPYALATARLSAWWETWAGGDGASCVLELGYVHDMLTALENGSADIVVCFDNALQPIELDWTVFDRIVVGSDKLRPFARADVAVAIDWPGRPDEQVPLLMYSPTVYFGRVVNLIVESANQPLHGQCVVECDMTDVLRNMALAGRGIAWLPEVSAPELQASALVAIDDGTWSIALTIVAFASRQDRSPAVDRIWSRIAGSAAKEHARHRQDVTTIRKDNR